MHLFNLLGRKKSAEFLLHHGVDSNAKDNEGNTPSHYAVLNSKSHVSTSKSLFIENYHLFQSASNCIIFSKIMA